MSGKNTFPHADTVMVLGTPYTIIDRTTEEEPRLKNYKKVNEEQLRMGAL